MKKEAIISSSRLNCYGTRVLTTGIDIEQYQKNPILLYMHRRGGREDMPIGRIENLRIEGDFLYGTPVFDGDSDEEKMIAKKWERGTLRMLSAGISIIEWSDDPKYLVQGQTRPTIVRSKLEEVSIVDIGANDDALQCALYNGSTRLTLAMGEENENLPLLKNNASNPTNNGEAEEQQTNKQTLQMNKIFLLLGLEETATEDAAVQKIQTLMNENKQLRLAAINDAVTTAIAEHRITEAQKAHFVNLGEKVGIEELRNTLSCFKPAVKPNDVIQRTGEQVELKWENCSQEQLEQLRNENRQEYCRLFKEHYGFEAQF
ncbi:MAG: hypothetical protein ACI4BD_05880 [Paludibacteraceae bacterium]